MIKLTDSKTNAPIYTRGVLMSVFGSNGYSNVRVDLGGDLIYYAVKETPDEVKAAFDNAETDLPLNVDDTTIQEYRELVADLNDEILDLHDEIADLEDENEDLQEQLYGTDDDEEALYTSDQYDENFNVTYIVNPDYKPFNKDEAVKAIKPVNALDALIDLTASFFKAK